jgi:hypothetical protein
MSSNATSHLNITYKAHRVTLPVPLYASNSSGKFHHCTRLVEVAHIIDSSAETHVVDLQHISEETSSMFKGEPISTVRKCNL